MQGIYINGRRPTTKKEIKEAVALHPDRVHIEATSLFGGEYDGPVSDMPAGKVAFVGPDPHTSRKFYGTIKRALDSDKVTVS